ncbi:hypothetical protein IX27_00260 [Streptomyces sp. JS01]|uniref:hypothetical protein n=1 Tax=Streptomyces sp. JS01 TaxID=1525753 RepID=UPI00050739C6|nr:hypothetical protein [Streptomyces sp. JS01]KFK91501.1 hypothetical protein IX27_00260 [Streptomyces sp. JS01]
MTSTVLMTITEDDVHKHREALCRWVEANGLNPKDIASAPGVTIERTGKRTDIVWRQFQRDDQGRIMSDPADPTTAWTVRKATRMTSPPAEHGYPETETIKADRHSGS